MDTARANPVRMELGKVVSRRFLESVLQEHRQEGEEPEHIEFGKIEARRGTRDSLRAAQRKSGALEIFRGRPIVNSRA